MNFFVKNNNFKVSEDKFLVIIPPSKVNGNEERKLYFSNVMELMEWLNYSDDVRFHGSVYFERHGYYFFCFDFDKRFKSCHKFCYKGE